MLPPLPFTKAHPDPGPPAAGDGDGAGAGPASDPPATRAAQRSESAIKPDNEVAGSAPAVMVTISKLALVKPYTNTTLPLSRRTRLTWSWSLTPSGFSAR